MLTKLFWVLLVFSLFLSFIYRDKIQTLYIDKFVNNTKKDDLISNLQQSNEAKNLILIKDYNIPNLTLATSTSISSKDKEYIYTFIKRLDGNTKEKVISVYYDNYKDVYLRIEKGEIRINTLNDIDIVWNDYLSAIGDSKLSYKLKNERDNLDYLDLRFPNKLFYKFKTYDQRILGTSTISSSTGQ